MVGKLWQVVSKISVKISNEGIDMKAFKKLKLGMGDKWYGLVV